jgi:hypothetical protein
MTSVRFRKDCELSSGGEFYDARANLLTTRYGWRHYSRCSGGGGAIGLAAFEGASRIAAWHLREALRFFGEFALPEELADAVRLDSWLTEHCRNVGERIVGKNRVRQHGPLRDGPRLRAALKELEELDRIRLRKDGRRLTIHLNPALVEVRNDTTRPD